MKLFHCDNCGNALFFENVKCLRCASDLAFLPTRMALAAIEEVRDAAGLWRRRKRGKAPSTRHFRLCLNNTEQQACNFAIPESDPNPLCVCCRLTQMLPDLSIYGNRERWFRIEAAKRRLFTPSRSWAWSPTTRLRGSKTARSSISWRTSPASRS